uniref:Aminotransferase-like plant mobile domain-containing protein n=1 Tax=Aegilops tauschii subsp. strangulata TaxID=200361 RepID=A0A453HH02_AEGTS
PPTLVHSVLTALIDRWRTEAHSFHLPCGEMTVTLEDWGMITGLPLEGH